MEERKVPPEERKVQPEYFKKHSKYPEVLFPNEFTTIHPWGAVPDKCPVDIGILRDIQVPICDLVHVTHNAEAGEICRDANNYEFKARQKFGKVLGAYDGRPCGESFRPSHDEDELKFVQIRDNETVFPGFYSWWGISLIGNRLVDDISKAIQEKWLARHFFVPNYLKEKSESHYGNNAFVSSLQNVLTAYAFSRKVEMSNVYMRKGGTLRYGQEICYVIIICTDEDREALKEFNPLTPISEPFQMHDLIDENGQINVVAAAPTFSPEFVATWWLDKSQAEFSKHTYSYETTAFALYFPNEEFSMRMDSENCTKKTIIHKEDRCTKKKPENGGRFAEWKCPNKID